MPQDPLLTQLAERTRTFSAGTGVTLNKIAKLVGVEPGNFSAFMNGRIGLSAKSTIKLLQLLGLTKRQVEEKLAIKPVNIVHFQEGGRKLAEQVRFAASTAKRFDWVPGLSGEDPNGTDDVTGIRTARDLPNADDYQQETIDFLRDQQNIHRSAIKAIDDYLSGIQKGKVNSGSTEPPRRINDNTRSQTPGPKPDQFSRR